MEPSIDLLTVPEAAEVLRISPAGVRRLIQSNDLPVHRIRSSVRIAREDIVAYLEGTKA
ncbi:MAG: helix-turn-helix domain-containing protein [Pseudomonadota bacterium]